MEYCGETNLIQFLKKFKGFKCPDELVFSIFSSILDAIEYMHKQQVCHRGVKLVNIMIDEDFRVKLVGFGLVAMTEPGVKMQEICGSVCYSCPEALSLREYDGKKADLWAAGVVLYFLITGKYPFGGNF